MKPYYMKKMKAATIKPIQRVWLIGKYPSGDGEWKGWGERGKTWRRMYIYMKATRLFVIKPVIALVLFCLFTPCVTNTAVMTSSGYHRNLSQTPPPIIPWMKTQPARSQTQPQGTWATRHSNSARNNCVINQWNITPCFHSIIPQHKTVSRCIAHFNTEAG